MLIKLPKSFRSLLLRQQGLLPSLRQKESLKRKRVFPETVLLNYMNTLVYLINKKGKALMKDPPPPRLRRAKKAPSTYQAKHFYKFLGRRIKYEARILLRFNKNF